MYWLGDVLVLESAIGQEVTSCSAQRIRASSPYSYNKVLKIGMRYIPAIWPRNRWFFVGCERGDEMRFPGTVVTDDDNSIGIVKHREYNVIRYTGFLIIL